MSHFKTSLLINSPRELVFEAITKKLDLWWGNQDQPISQDNIEFTVSWGKPWYRFKVLKYIENQTVVWECTDANQIIQGLDGVQKEWVGTQIHWKLNAVSDQETQLFFEHKGLIPSFICFDFCVNSWQYFLEERLIKFITT